ncbi:leucine zipper domain-containing protein [Legionella pneumophila 130b]|nr:leucine zipper domain-containing protein [Legionella pneumophila 130b]
MDEKIKFVARLLDGEQMSSLCQEFGISRKTGHKIYNRYKESGLEGLNDRSRKPHRYANQLPFQLEKEILKVKKEKPTWELPRYEKRY